MPRRSSLRLTNDWEAAAWGRAQSPATANHHLAAAISLSGVAVVRLTRTVSNAHHLREARCQNIADANSPVATNPDFSVLTAGLDFP